MVLLSTSISVKTDTTSERTLDFVQQSVYKLVHTPVVWGHNEYFNRKTMGLMNRLQIPCVQPHCGPLFSKLRVTLHTGLPGL